MYQGTKPLIADNNFIFRFSFRSSEANPPSVANDAKIIGGHSVNIFFHVMYVQNKEKYNI